MASDEESDSEDQNVAELVAEEEAPKCPFDFNTQLAVCDLRSLCALPPDPEQDGMRTFRVMIFKKGRVLKVPSAPGCYATNADWRVQIALALVHFVPATKRKAELLLCFVDMGMVCNSATGMFVESLQLPLKKARNLSDEAPRLTKMADVSGFTRIDPMVQPWCNMLKQALERVPIYQNPKIYTPNAIIDHMRIKLETRIVSLAMWCRGDIAKTVSGLKQQDLRAAEKAAALYEGRLASVLQWLALLPPNKYDVRMAERVVEMGAGHPDADKPPWLKTPERVALHAGTAERPVCTSVAVRRLPSPPAAAAGPSSPPAAPGTQQFSDASHESDPMLDVEVEAARERVGERKRTAPARYTAGSPNKKGKQVR